MKPWITEICEGLKRVLSLPAVQDIILRVIARILFGSPRDALLSAWPYKIRDPEYIRREVIRLNLPRREGFDTQSKEEWATIYNGWGPDSWPYALRAVITWSERYVEALAGPHDDIYAHSDGTPEGWKVAMQNWIIGNPIVLNDKFPMSKWWLWPMRAATWIKAEAAIAALEKWSFSAWVSAHEGNGCFG